MMKNLLVFLFPGQKLSWTFFGVKKQYSNQNWSQVSSMPEDFLPVVYYLFSLVPIFLRDVLSVSSNFVVNWRELSENGIQANSAVFTVNPHRAPHKPSRQATHTRWHAVERFGSVSMCSTQASGTHYGAGIVLSELPTVKNHCWWRSEAHNLEGGASRNRRRTDYLDFGYVTCMGAADYR